MPRILVLCEGAVTEPQYLKAFKAWCRNPRVDVVIAEERGVPLTLVEAAKKRKWSAKDEAARNGDDNLAFDEVWCVFDIDEHPNLDGARQAAQANGIRLAVSNPCFELWLLLHFRDGPGARHRHDVQRMMRGFVVDYDKHVAFDRYQHGYAQAVARARRLDDDATSMDEAGRNPTTGVYHLTESIRSSDRVT